MLSNEDLKTNAKHLILDLMQMKTFCENPQIIKDGKGVFLTSIDGKRYFDGISGIYVACIGHGNEEVIEAIRRQHERVAFVAPLAAVSDMAIEYATELAKISPEGLNTMKPVSGGSEATETALKFARQYHRQSGSPGKYKVISLYKGFHGGTLGAMSMSGLGGPRKSVFGPFLEGFVHIGPPHCLRCPYGQTHPECKCLCARMLDQYIVWEGPESVAAFIMEPISNTAGIMTPPDEYFQIVREICSKHNVLMIFDEIITGMGRTGNWFAAQTFDVVPDMLCSGKGLSGGYAPLANVAIRDDLHFSTFWGEKDENIHFAHGHTYGANPISCAAGLAVINVIRENNLLENGQKIGDHIRNRLARDIAELGILGEVRGKGCLTGVEFVEDMETKRSFPAERNFGKRVEERLLANGVILRCDPNWIGFGPPLIMTIDEADEMLDIFVKCVSEELRSAG